MEEVIGDIKDEFDDEPEVIYKKIDDFNYAFEGKTLLNDLCRVIGLDTSTFDEVKGESDSLAGLILEIIAKLPEKDEEVFAEVYKKAKSVGGNTFIIKSPEQVDGTQVFNPAHYYIYVYYTEAEKIAKEQNLIYIINPNKEVQLRINNTKQKLLPRTYIKYDISKTEITDISVGTILGSRIKFQPKEGQPEQYFQLSGKKVKANPEDNPGINFKTGDIIKLEKSYAQFLINIYQRVEVK